MLLTPNPQNGLTNINVKLDNEKLVCSFKRTKYIPDVDNYFDLNEKYYLLFAKGSLKQDGIVFL